MCILCHASWPTHQVRQGTRAWCMVNFSVTIIKLEHKWLHTAPVRKNNNLVIGSILCKINNICKREKLILQSAFFDVARGWLATARPPSRDFYRLPFQTYFDNPVLLVQFAWNILRCFDLPFSMIFFFLNCIYRWLELSESTEWLAPRTALRQRLAWRCYDEAKMESKSRCSSLPWSMQFPVALQAQEPNGDMHDI